MKDIYLNPDLYDALHNDIGTDENVIKYYAKKCNGPVLEIACGTGRLSKYIIDLGLPYTGIDNSKPFLNISVQKFGKNGTFLYNDMQDFKLAKKFDFIFIGFNSFLHNLTDKDALNCLRCVREHLNSDGIFLLSIFILEVEIGICSLWIFTVTNPFLSIKACILLLNTYLKMSLRRSLLNRNKSSNNLKKFFNDFK